MKYPKLRKPYEHRAELQNLSGGLNTYLPPHLISFNEQSEIENMFYYKGSLQKRPCFKKVSELEGYLVSNIETANGVFIYKHSIDEKGSGSFSSAFVTKEGNLITVADIPLSKEYEFESDLRGKTAYCFFPFYFNEILYLGIGFKDDYNGFMSKVYKFSQGEFILINDEEIYAPLIMLNGKGNNFSSLALGNNSIYSPQISFEGVNLLTKRVRCQYTTDGSSFSFPFLIKRKYGTPVKVKFTGCFEQNSDIEEISFVIDTDSTIAKIPGHNNIVCHVSHYKNVSFKNTDNSGHPPIAAAFSNNLEIEYYIEENINAKSLFEMGLQTTFGANRGTGGNRLFVAGNKTEKNLLRWSDLNNPLYFPENNFSYVSNGEILSLNKQGNMLLIFSNDEIHYATYLGGSYATEDFTSGSVSDITAISALFPISLLHSDVGAFNKNSVILLNNKTYFFGNDKKLYRIDGTNKITHISQKIDNFFKENNFEFSAVGKFLDYCLLITDKGIVAFNIQSESFYIWEDKIKAQFVLKNEDEPIIIASDGVYKKSNLENTEFSFTTATIDLNHPEKYKKISKIIVNGEGGEVSININGKPKIFRKISKNQPIFLNIPKIKNFSISLKNCNNFESVIFYYTLY